ncbi:MAG TPA: hypothetical protein VMX16_09280 [Terriglobia bacterium]|nr:hypothetical protein [Terriglobia bacterium]
MKYRTMPLLCLLVVLAPFRAGSATQQSPASPLDTGYRQMYNLQFSAAHSSFQEWEQMHSSDPLGPTSDAAAYLFAEFDRLGILQSRLFVSDKHFVQRQVEQPDPAAKKAFDAALERSNRLASEALAKSPQDTNALFAEVMNLGMRADYLALIEKRNLASLSMMKRNGLLADKLLKLDPNCYDAYLAVGVENYVLGLSPAPLRWLLSLYGAQTDKNAGLRKLRLTAEKGHYLRPFARLLLAVAALRNHDRNQARRLLRALAQEFPKNVLYRKELAKLQ